MSTIYGKLGGASAVDTTDRDLLAQALEALRFGLHVGFDESSESQIKKGGKAFDQHSKAIAALRERLAQPEQEENDGMA
jgi:hypothetical protein